MPCGSTSEVSCARRIGGHAYALRSFSQPVVYCEIDGKVADILRAAMRKGHIAEAPVHADVRTIAIPAGVELITASWPCARAPISQ